MRYLIFILFLLSDFSGITAQDYTVDWGPTYRMSSGVEGQNEFLGIHGNHYYILSHDRRSAHVLKYGMDHKLVDTSPFMFSANVNRLVIGGSIRTKNASFLYMYSVDSREKEWRMFVSRFVNGQFSQPKQVYSERFDVQNKQINRAFGNYENFGGPQLIVSPDSSHVAFIDLIPSLDYKDDDVVSVAVFDTQMNLKWQVAWFYKFSRKEYEITQKVVSNDGEVYLVGWNHFKRKGSKRGSRSKSYLPDHEYKLYKISTDDIQETPVDLGEWEVPLDVKMFFSNDNSKEYLVAGFYTDDDIKSRLKGLFFSNGNTLEGITSTKVNPFKKSFLKNLTSERAAKKGKGLEFSYKIMDVLYFSDGNMGFIAEDNYDVVSTTTDPYYGGYYYGGVGLRNSYYNRSINQHITYYSNDIIIPLFSKDGELLNIQKVYKAYNSSTRSHTGYQMAKANDKVYLVFNDFKSKAEKEKIDKKNKKKKGRHYTDILVLDSRGNIETQQNLFNDREIDLSFVTRWSDYANNKLLIGTMRGRRFAFGTVILN